MAKSTKSDMESNQIGKDSPSIESKSDPKPLTSESLGVWSKHVEKISQIPQERSIYAFSVSIVMFAGVSLVLSSSNNYAKIVGFSLAVAGACFALFLGWKEQQAHRDSIRTITVKIARRDSDDSISRLPEVIQGLRALQADSTIFLSIIIE